MLQGTTRSSGGLGWAVSSAGDFDSDGREDVLVAAPYSNKCYLIYGDSTLSASASSASSSRIMIEDYVSAAKSRCLAAGVWIGSGESGRFQ